MRSTEWSAGARVVTRPGGLGISRKPYCNRCSGDQTSFLASGPSTKVKSTMLRVATMALVCLSATNCFSPLGAAHRPYPRFHRSGCVISDAQAIGRSVAEWCMASGRPEATIAVSPATNVIDAMHDFWLTARTFGGESGTPDRQRILAFPAWQKMLDAQTFPEVIQHIEGCSDICAHLGESLLIAGRHPAAAVSADEPPSPVPIIVLRSFRQEAFGDFSQENYGVEDPFAVLPDDDFINDDAGERGDTVSDEQCRSKAATHVTGIAKQLGLSPTDAADTADAADAADVAYQLTHAVSGEAMYESFFTAARQLTSTPESGHACTMLVAPTFSRYNSNGFEFFAASLTEALEDLGLGEQVQLVFFHPEYTITDRDMMLGVDHALSSVPLPSVGLLRTPHVERARQGEEVGSVQTQALIEIHERLCGEGGMIEFDPKLSGVKLGLGIGGF